VNNSSILITYFIFTVLKNGIEGIKGLDGIKGIEGRMEERKKITNYKLEIKN